MLLRMGYHKIMCPNCGETDTIHEDKFYEEGFTCKKCEFHEDDEYVFDYDEE